MVTRLSSPRPLLSIVAVLGLAGGIGAAAPDWSNDLSPITQRDWTYATAAHLIERAGFGATPEEIARMAAMPPQQVVDRLVDYDTIPDTLPPFEESVIWDPGMDPFPPSRAEAVRIARLRGEGLGEKILPPGAQRRLQPVVDKFFYSLAANQIETQRMGLWWANRMLVTGRPLEEKLTLFWHGHFATGENKVRDYRMMLQQNRMFRAHASGNFRDLLVGLLKDPAMLVYLDNGENIRSHPNENFGRELLELFTMGVGNYTERDVREAARSFTGWTNDVLSFKFDRDQHDPRDKTFLGRTGPLDGEDVIDTILAQPVTAEYVSAKIYRFFARDDIAPAVRSELGRTLRDSRYELKPLLKRIFLSKDFYSAPSRGTQIKGPVALVVSTYKKMGLRELPTVPDFGQMTASLGQSLFDPPNVAGWAGGRTWITPATLLQRGNLFRGVLFPDLKNFRAPDRSMSATDARVGQRVSQGIGITEATREDNEVEMNAESNMMVDRDEDYNTRYAGYKGSLLAFERTRLIPRKPAVVSLTTMVQEAGATGPDAIVEHFAHRFLSVPLGDQDRRALVAYARETLDMVSPASGATYEERLRELLYLVLSTPAYQLG
jgi:uncharacterized protein (DUF1800 family)